MSDIVVPTDGFAAGPELREVGDALARVLRAHVRSIRLGPEASAEDAVATLGAALARPGALLCVLPGDPSPEALCWRVVRAVRRAVVMVPPGCTTTHDGIGRVLLPLDGTPEAASAVAAAAELLAESGVDLVALHVFDAEHIPRFWDQPAHAGWAWGEEFLMRHLPAGQARLELRRGTPGKHVIDVAGAEGVDLIVLGWSRTFAEGRAQTVRRAVADSTVPVLLCPVDEGEGEDCTAGQPADAPS